MSKPGSRTGSRPGSGWQTPTIPGWATPDGIKKQLNAVDGYLQREREQRRQAIGGLDAAWLVMEKETSFSPVCAATYTYGEGMTLEKLEAAIVEQGKVFPRYRQKLTDTFRKLHGPRFVDDPDFDIKQHLTTFKLPGKAGPEELEAKVGRFIAEPFDLSRPLWDTIFIPNYRDEHGARSAMITRGHHTLADGQGFVASQLYITAYGPELKKQMAKGAEMLAQAKHGDLKPSKISKGLKGLDKAAENPVTAPFVKALLFVLYWVTALGSLLTGTFWGIVHALHLGLWYNLTIWRAPKPTIYYHGPRVLEREFATSKAYPVSQVKAIQQAFSGSAPGSKARKAMAKRGRKSKVGHVTLNDVAVACMTDALQQEIDKVPKPKGIWPQFIYYANKVLPARIGLFIPISVRKPGDWSMRNLSTGASVFMTPMQTAEKVTPASLYTHIHRAKGELGLIKRSRLPQALFRVIQACAQTPILYAPLGALPTRVSTFIEDWITLPAFKFFFSGFTAVLTNVPGPPERTQLQGVDILSWTALPPQALDSTLGLGLITYGGDFSISVAADRIHGSEGVSRRVCQAFEKRFELYLRLANEILEEEKQA